MSADREISVRVTGLVKRFHDHVVLDGVDLEVPRGSSLALIGPSACGKTVLLKCLLGLYHADGGSIEIDGQDVTRLSRADQDEMMKRIGVLFQQNALFDSMPIWENICFRLLSEKQLTRRAAKDRAVELLAQVGMGPEVADLFPADLSGGMQKRVGLARAIAGNPEILILDDPTAGLDPILAHAIDRLVDNLVAQNQVTAIAITGEMNNIRDRYRRVALLHDQKIQWQGRTTEIDDSHHAALMQMVEGEAEGPIQMLVEA
ncbi:ABC transporter ATP-binding protein [Aestuariispira insulae]|uniref:Phospholipid/cholesterol/gamma-HCH transport system ATP-binding protein n=1 Tax=Aestuariispira insulae TaxID=1461337 RepID=A0A3D9H6F6_9PROT|nr:ATP-binding cassette domain-containing protein [Aestuariispira insulae]RED45095.1 phospholipid/cholesterol/gamma-HCH transport system ATP-binding protein [Aestuariispira insulae]